MDTELKLQKAQSYHPITECLPPSRFVKEYWYRNHFDALRFPVDFEVGIVHGLQAWLDYAGQHARSYSSLIGEDGVIGEHWKDWGLAIRGLLNGVCGRLDCGTVDGFILRVLQEHGINTDEL